MIKLIASKHMGFCTGVARAVEKAYETAAGLDGKKKCATLGPLIHNSQVTDDLAARGVSIINSLDELKEGPFPTVIIRAHGVPPCVEEEMNLRSIEYIDMTCPFVKAIHRRAIESAEEGRTLVVLGKATHPEVIGIRGYANDAIVIESVQEAKALDPSGRYTIVAQTTYSIEIFEAVAEVMTGFDAIIHNTACKATAQRQHETESISKTVDTMIILGDPTSANSKNLYEISKKNCDNTIFAQSINDIRLQDLSSHGRIGLTAGASTPPSVTKEAISVMSEINNDVPTNQTQQSFEEMLDESFVTLHTGDVVKGTVIQVTSSDITVNLGYKSDGIITKSEFTDDSSADLTAMVTPGEEVEVLVMRVNDGDGNVLASKRRLEAQTNYKLIEQAYNEKTSVTGKITDLVKGGLIASVFGNRVFVPSSQISNRYVEDLTVFKGKEFTFNILEFDRSKRRIVAGRRELANAEHKARREELFSSLEVGQKIEGTVSRITDFGAFIDLGGVDGLVHISELAWRRVRKVSDVLSVGDPVVVTVIDVNPEKNKISLTLKDINNNPWTNIAEKYPVGSLIEGKVVRMAAFGAFVNLEDGVDGLVHVSQIAEKHVAKPEDELSVNQVITVKVTDVDEENKKISLSKKHADAELRGDDGYDDDYDDDDYDDDDYDDDMIEEEPEETDTNPHLKPV